MTTRTSTSNRAPELEEGEKWTFPTPLDGQDNHQSTNRTQKLAEDENWASATPPNDEEAAVQPSKKEVAATKDPNLVDWEENDKGNPRNWSNGRKSIITFQLSMLALAASLGSSITAPAEAKIATYVGVSDEVSVLSISLYM